MPKKIYENSKEHQAALLEKLPDFARMYIRHFSINAQERSVYAYCYDLILFFQFLIDSNPVFKGRETSQFSAAELESLKPQDIEEFLAGLRDEGNNASALRRKLASVHGLFDYLITREMIDNDPSIRVKLKDKSANNEIVYLTDEESLALVKYIKERIINKEETHAAQHEKERIRDTAITTLLLGTGIRVSELVGIDREDVDFSTNKVDLTRKGGENKYVFFSDYVAAALLDYMEQREFIEAADDDAKKALFLSSHRKRITTRSVENLISRYAKAVVPYKHISPHKLRASFATSVLHQTSNIAVVSSALNHKNLNTTKRYYSKVLDSDLRQAAENSALRDRN